MKHRVVRWVLVIVALVALGVGATAWNMRAEAHRLELNINLAAAVKQGDPREIRRLVLDGADPNTPEDYLPVKEFYWDRLKRTLLRKPAPRQGKGMTPLMVAAAYEDLGLVQTLLERGADPKASVYGMNALLFACGGGDAGFPDSPAGEPKRPTASSAREVIRALLEAGADPNQQVDFERDTPYRYAIGLKDDAIDRLFLQHRAKWNVPNRFGQTMLSHAVYEGRTELVRQMLAEGADPNEEESRHGETVLMYAAEGNHLEIARMLLAAGARANLTDTSVRSNPLNEAVDNGSAEMVRLLLDHGARPGQKDGRGHTAFDRAHDRGDRQILQLLKAGK